MTQPTTPSNPTPFSEQAATGLSSELPAKGEPSEQGAHSATTEHSAFNPASLSAGDAIAELTAELNAAQAELATTHEAVAKHKDDYLRAQAELANARRRADEEKAKALKFGIEKFARDLLNVKDSLDQALAQENLTIEAFKDGVAITQRQLQGVLERAAITEINAAGAKFDPNQHQAIAQVDSEQEPNTVVAVMQKGYLLQERVLRAAMVTVAKTRTE